MQGEPQTKRILLLASERWISTARLALAFSSFGCEVELMARASHPALTSGVVRRSHPYDVLKPVESILKAIRASCPDIVVPVDEQAVLHVEELREAAEASTGEDQEAVRSLLAFSGDRAETMALGRSRIALLRLASGLGVAVPETVSVPEEEAIDDAVERLGLPLALKADATFGGRGVRIVGTPRDAHRAWRRLHESSTFVAALRRGLVWGEWSFVREWARGVTRDVAAQRVVRGSERTAMAVAVGGDLRAVVCLEVLQTAEYLGPSSVLRVVEDEAMVDGIRRVVRGAGVTGFCGFDFMVDSTTARPLMIEMNLRPTQLVHLPLGPGRDLVAAFLREVLGMPVADRPAATTGDLIALFPQELNRSPSSEWLDRAFHDVPWNAPELIRVATKKVPQRLRSDPRWTGGR